jgi:hypothetical protein
MDNGRRPKIRFNDLPHRQVAELYSNKSHPQFCFPLTFTFQSLLAIRHPRGECDNLNVTGTSLFNPQSKAASIHLETRAEGTRHRSEISSPILNRMRSFRIEYSEEQTDRSRDPACEDHKPPEYSEINESRRSPLIEYSTA